MRRSAGNNYSSKMDKNSTSMQECVPEENGILREVIQEKGQVEDKVMYVAVLTKAATNVWPKYTSTLSLAITFEVIYRKRTRNSFTSHIALKVSLSVWCRQTRAERLHMTYSEYVYRTNACTFRAHLRSVIIASGQGWRIRTTKRSMLTVQSKENGKPQRGYPQHIARMISEETGRMERMAWLPLVADKC